MDLALLPRVASFLVAKQFKANMTKGNTSPFSSPLVSTNLPFLAPKKYYDLYPAAEMIDLPKKPDVPKDFPPIARGTGGE